MINKVAPSLQVATQPQPQNFPGKMLQSVNQTQASGKTPKTIVVKQNSQTQRPSIEREQSPNEAYISVEPQGSPPSSSIQRVFKSTASKKVMKETRLLNKNRSSSNKDHQESGRIQVEGQSLQGYLKPSPNLKYDHKNEDQLMQSLLNYEKLKDIVDEAINERSQLVSWEDLQRSQREHNSFRQFQVISEDLKLSNQSHQKRSSSKDPIAAVTGKAISKISREPVRGQSTLKNQNSLPLQAILQPEGLEELIHRANVSTVHQEDSIQELNYSSQEPLKESAKKFDRVSSFSKKLDTLALHDGEKSFPSSSRKGRQDSAAYVIRENLRSGASRGSHIKRKSNTNDDLGQVMPKEKSSRKQMKREASRPSPLLPTEQTQLLLHDSAQEIVEEDSHKVIAQPNSAVNPQQSPPFPTSPHMIQSTLKKEARQFDNRAKINMASHSDNLPSAPGKSSKEFNLQQLNIELLHRRQAEGEGSSPIPRQKTEFMPAQIKEGTQRESQSQSPKGETQEEVKSAIASAGDRTTNMAEHNRGGLTSFHNDRVKESPMYFTFENDNFNLANNVNSITFQSFQGFEGQGTGGHGLRSKQESRQEKIRFEDGKISEETRLVQNSKSATKTSKFHRFSEGERGEVIKVAHIDLNSKAGTLRPMNDDSVANLARSGFSRRDYINAISSDTKSGDKRGTRPLGSRNLAETSYLTEEVSQMRSGLHSGKTFDAHQSGSNPPGFQESYRISKQFINRSFYLQQKKKLRHQVARVAPADNTSNYNDSYSDNKTSFTRQKPIYQVGQLKILANNSSHPAHSLEPSRSSEGDLGGGPELQGPIIEQVRPQKQKAPSPPRQQLNQIPEVSSRNSQFLPHKSTLSHKRHSSLGRTKQRDTGFLHQRGLVATVRQEQTNAKWMKKMDLLRKEQSVISNRTSNFDLLQLNQEIGRDTERSESKFNLNTREVSLKDVLTSGNNPSSIQMQSKFAGTQLKFNRNLKTMGSAISSVLQQSTLPPLKEEKKDKGTGLDEPTANKLRASLPSDPSIEKMGSISSVHRKSSVGHDLQILKKKTEETKKPKAEKSLLDSMFEGAHKAENHPQLSSKPGIRHRSMVDINEKLIKPLAQTSSDLATIVIPQQEYETALMSAVKCLDKLRKSTKKSLPRASQAIGNSPNTARRSSRETSNEGTGPEKKFYRSKLIQAAQIDRKGTRFVAPTMNQSSPCSFENQELKNFQRTSQDGLITEASVENQSTTHRKRKVISVNADTEDPTNSQKEQDNPMNIHEQTNPTIRSPRDAESSQKVTNMFAPSQKSPMATEGAKSEFNQTYILPFNHTHSQLPDIVVNPRANIIYKQGEETDAAKLIFADYLQSMPLLDETLTAQQQSANGFAQSAIPKLQTLKTTSLKDAFNSGFFTSRQFLEQQAKEREGIKIFQQLIASRMQGQNSSKMSNKKAKKTVKIKNLTQLNKIFRQDNKKEQKRKHSIAEILGIKSDIRHLNKIEPPHTLLEFSMKLARQSQEGNPARARFSSVDAPNQRKGRGENKHSLETSTDEEMDYLRAGLGFEEIQENEEALASEEKTFMEKGNNNSRASSSGTKYQTIPVNHQSSQNGRDTATGEDMERYNELMIQMKAKKVVEPHSSKLQSHRPTQLQLRQYDDYQNTELMDPSKMESEEHQHSQKSLAIGSKVLLMQEVKSPVPLKKKGVVQPLNQPQPAANVGTSKQRPNQDLVESRINFSSSKKLTQQQPLNRKSRNNLSRRNLTSLPEYTPTETPLQRAPDNKLIKSIQVNGNPRKEELKVVNLTPENQQYLDVFKKTKDFFNMHVNLKVQKGTHHSGNLIDVASFPNFGKVSSQKFQTLYNDMSKKSQAQAPADITKSHLQFLRNQSKKSSNQNVKKFVMSNPQTNNRGTPNSSLPQLGPRPQEKVLGKPLPSHQKTTARVQEKGVNADRDVDSRPESVQRLKNTLESDHVSAGIQLTSKYNISEQAKRKIMQHHQPFIHRHEKGSQDLTQSGSRAFHSRHHEASLKKTIFRPSKVGAVPTPDGRNQNPKISSLATTVKHNMSIYSKNSQSKQSTIRVNQRTGFDSTETGDFPLLAQPLQTGGPGFSHRNSMPHQVLAPFKQATDPVQAFHTNSSLMELGVQPIDPLKTGHQVVRKKKIDASSISQITLGSQPKEAKANFYAQALSAVNQRIVLQIRPVVNAASVKASERKTIQKPLGDKKKSIKFTIHPTSSSKTGQPLSQRTIEHVLGSQRGSQQREDSVMYNAQSLHTKSSMEENQQTLRMAPSVVDESFQQILPTSSNLESPGVRHSQLPNSHLKTGGQHYDSSTQIIKSSSVGSKVNLLSDSRLASQQQKMAVISNPPQPGEMARYPLVQPADLMNSSREDSSRSGRVEEHLIYKPVRIRTFEQPFINSSSFNI